MKFFFKTIFNQFYVWGLKLNFANSPHLSAMYFLAFILTFNFIGITILIRLFLGYTEVTVQLIYPELFVFLLGLILMIYFLHVKNGNYLVFYNKYLKKTVREQRKMKIFTYLYILFSIFLSYGVAIYIGMVRKGVL